MKEGFFVPQYRCLTIAGTDSGGGAGIQADLKTFSALGTFGCSVITALTAQNTQGVQGIFAIAPEFVRQQADAVFSDIDIDAVKIGMLADEAIIREVAQIIIDYRPKFVVLDPVMVAKGGAPLLAKQAEQALNEYLLPLADVVTPNLPEMAALLATSVATDKEQMLEQAQQLLQQKQVKNVLLKGGHLNSAEAADCLVLQDGSHQWFSSRRIDTKHVHGTGCTFSSAIAALRPQSANLTTAVSAAKDFVQNAIDSAQQLNVGKGIGPLNHFYALKR